MPSRSLHIGWVRSNVREMVCEMIRMTYEILILGIILILAILAALIYCGIITFPYQ
jgi:hypothetical protein